MSTSAIAVRRSRALAWNTVAVPGADPADRAAAALTRMASGDRSAVGDLYDELSASVYGTVRRVVRDPARSEELTQEIFVEAWRTAARFDAARGTGRTWVLTMAHRRAVDCVRSEQRRRDREAREATSAPNESDGPAEIVERRAERQLVAEALDGLSELQRRAIELAYYGGHTHREIAELLDLPLGTVKTRIRDGLIRLRAVLGADR
ncbi:MAG: ECF RNA polymerase sigma factor SigK [Actinomycetota bacterium]